MSLNGLDAPELKEAHAAAAAEPGGWFLLKYSGRDAVELLDKGSGGIVEIRNAIAQYDEPSPLYGFLRYRRRNVIIKYLPDDCSRLVQARVTVHLDSICECFSPHDTVFDIAAAKELKDTRLSAACSLHAASGSMSSSTSSLRRRRLMEIAEEEEEEQRAIKRQSVGGTEEPCHPNPAAERPVALDSGLAASPEASQFSGTAEPPLFVGASRSASPVQSLEACANGPFNVGRPDLSSQHSSSSFSSRPKVKLGPRPSLDTSGRPRTAAGSGFRPISTIPAGFKMMSKTGSKKDRLQGADEEHADVDDSEGPSGESCPVPALQPEDAPLPGEHLPTPGSLEAGAAPAPRPHTSGGRAVAAPTARPGQGAMSLEKSRLMKAMQLREKKKKEQEALKAAAGGESTTPSDNSAVAPDQSSFATTEIFGEPFSSDAGQKSPESASTTAESGAAEDHAPPGTKYEAAEDLSSSLPPDRASLDAQTDSHPASPVVASSEIGNSTKASSVSESTDETALESKSDLANEGNPADEASSHRPSTPTPAAIDHGDMEPEGTGQPEQSEKEDTADLAPTLPRLSPTEKARVASCDWAHSDALPSPALEHGSSILGGTYDDDGNAGSHPLLDTPRPNPNTPPVESTPTCEPPASLTETQQQQQRFPEASLVNLKGSSGGMPTPMGDVESSHPSSGLGAAELELDSNPSRRLRAPAVGPIVTSRVAETAALSDDEALMDELQSATLHEARPMLVSKSPITPVFPAMSDGEAVGNDGGVNPLFKSGAEAAAIETPGSAQTSSLAGTETSPVAAPAPARHMTRAVSNPTTHGSSPSGGDVGQPPQSLNVTRAASSGPTFLQRAAQQASGSCSPAAASTPAKKVGMGSSISQRIKALEKLSSASGGLASPSGVPERPQSAFFAVRPTSVREPSRSPSVAERASSLRADKRTPSPPRSRDRDMSAVVGGGLRERSGSISSRLSVFEGGSLPRGRPESIQVTARIVRDPVHSLTKAPETPRADSAEAILDLKQSLLVVDHQRSTTSAYAGETLEAAVEMRKPTILQRRLSRGTRQSQTGDDDGAAAETYEDSDATAEGHSRRRSSLTIVRDFIKERRSSLLSARSPSTDNLGLGTGPSPSPSPSPNAQSRSPSRPPSTHRNSVFPRRLSVSSRRSSVSKDREGVVTPLLSPSRTVETSVSGDEAIGRLGGDAPAPKKAGSGSGGSSGGKSRASRFIRRLSNSLTSSRKSAATARSPTVAEEAYTGETGHALHGMGFGGAQQPQQPAIVAYMGDVNIQFPDNLLWKRRTMCLDSQGFLILSTGQGVAAAPTLPVSGAAGITKRYHLSDFRAPYAPEMEQQELPNSVCLEFVDGSSLQIACEDRAGQLNTLQELQAAHCSHTTFGQ